MALTIQDLISEGKDIVSRCAGSTMGIAYYAGAEYQKWLRKAMRFVDVEFPEEKDTQEFRDIAARANGGETKHFDALIGILEAFDTIPSKQKTMETADLIIQICKNFNRFDVDIKRRYGGRSSISITDEYDLQDCLRAILKLFVDDIRPEDYVPSYAGSNSRVDFLLPACGIVIETKMTRKGLSDKEVGEQLTIDFHRYKELKKCSHLISFVYDKDSIITNPHGLVSDLENLSDAEMRMTVIIAP